MARLQILELPEGAGDDRPPFVLVIDQVPTDEDKFDAIRRDLGTPEDLVERIGARAVLVFEDTIEIPANDTSAYLRDSFPADAHYEMTITEHPEWNAAAEAQAEAIARVRQLHRPVEYRGRGTICAACSGWDGSTTDNSPCGYEHCPTLLALNGEQERT
ncbi:hypothetical protein [Streptomyces niveus]